MFVLKIMDDVMMAIINIVAVVVTLFALFPLQTNEMCYINKGCLVFVLIF